MDGGEDDTEKKEVKEGKKSECDCDCGQDPCVKCGKSHHDIKEEKDSKEMKSCPEGKYWCMTDKKCKKIPKGWHVMKSGYLMKDKEHEEKEENKNGNGNGEGSESNGGGVSEGADYSDIISHKNHPNPMMRDMPVSQRHVDKLVKAYAPHVKNQLMHSVESIRKARESAKNTKIMKSPSVTVAEDCGGTHETKKKKKKLSEMISTSSVTGRRFRDVSGADDQEQLEKEKNKRKKERSEKYKAHLEKLRGETREKGVRFYDKKGSGYIRDGKKVYDESAKLDEKCWDGYKQLGMKKKGKRVVPNCVKEDSIDENKSGDSSLRDWFTKSRASDGTPGWVQLGGKYAGKPCAKQPGQTTKPKCGSSKMKRNLDDEEEQRAFERKNRQDPNPDRKGRAKMVATEQKSYQVGDTIPDSATKPKPKPTGAARFKFSVDKTGLKGPDKPLTTEEKDACYKKVKSRYSVWPSAYASGALVKCRKVGAKNWGNKTKKESYEFSNWRDEFKATEYETIDIVKPEPMKGLSEGPSFEIGGGHKKAQKMGKIRNLSKGATGGEKDAAQAALKRLGGGISLPLADEVIYPGQLKTEDYQKLQSTGNVFSIMLMWRGKTYRLQLFFAGPKRPSREEVKDQIQKFYPGGVLTHYYPSPSDPSQPIVVIQGK